MKVYEVSSGNTTHLHSYLLTYQKDGKSNNAIYVSKCDGLDTKASTYTIVYIDHKKMVYDGQY